MEYEEFFKWSQYFYWNKNFLKYCKSLKCAIHRCLRYWMGIQLDYSNKSLELMFSNFLQILTITWHFRKHQNLENSCLIPFFFLILKQPKVLSVCWLFPVIRLSHFQKVIISGKLWQYLGMPKLCPTPGQVPKCYIQILYYLIIPFLMSSSLLRFRKKKKIRDQFS